MVLDPTIPDWLTIPKGKKEAMWALLCKIFIFPRGTQERVKHYAKKMLGETFRRWKSDLNTKYVQKGREPFVEYGEITWAQWEEFVQQKASKEGLALSQRNRELALSNIHKVHLGPGGYQRQLEKWRLEREAAIAAGQPDTFQSLDERVWMWQQESLR
jgi:hypothetical protein